MRRVVVLCFLVVAALAAHAAPAHAQQDAGQLAAEPAPGSSLAATGDYFLLRPTAGATVRQALVIRNDYKRPIDIRLAAVDATTGPYGGVSYGLPGDASTRVGKWIALERRSLRLPAGASTQVAFTVSVPAGVTSGEHLAGLAIWSPAPAEKQAERGAGQTGAAVTIQTRRVIAVLVRLPGPAEPSLAVTGATPAARSNGVYLEVGIENRGSGLTKASGVITLPEENFRRTFEVDSLVPGTAIAYPVKWLESPREGDYPVRVELQFAGRATSWEGMFTVGDEVVEELIDRGAIVPGASGTGDESGRNDGALLAAGAAAAAVALSSALAGAIWLVSRRRRRRRAGGGAPGSLREGSPGAPARSDDVDSALLLRPAVAESPLPDNGGTEPARAGGTAGAGMGDRVPVRRAPARTDRASAQLDDSEKDSRAAAAVGATAVVGGALWLLIRARNRTRS